MNTDNEEFVFMSVFYSRDKWHDLLVQLRKILYDQPCSTTSILQSIVYLNLKRGAGIRIALKFQPHESGRYKLIEKSINIFLKEYPSVVIETEHSITGFFKDFTNNEIRYNLFNERAIMPGKLFELQLIISKILTSFFEDHQVDDDGVFTLLVYLQERLLNAISPVKSLKQLFCSKLLNEFEMNGDKKFSNLINTTNMKDIGGIDHSKEASLATLLSQLEYFSRLLITHTADPINVYFTILSVVQLQLFRTSSTTFYEALKYLHHSMNEEKMDDVFSNYL